MFLPRKRSPDGVAARRLRTLIGHSPRPERTAAGLTIHERFFRARPHTNTVNLFEPRPDHFIAFLDPAFVRHRSGMRVRGGGADVFDGQTSGVADYGADPVGDLVRQNLDVDVETKRGGAAVRECKRQSPIRSHVDTPSACSCFCAPQPPWAMFRRRVEIANGSTEFAEARRCLVCKLIKSFDYYHGWRRRNQRKNA